MPELHLVSPATPDTSDAAAEVARSLRAHFRTGATKPLRWRLSQLEALDHLLAEREHDILEALHADLGKPETEAYTSEVGMIRSEIRLFRKKLRSWVKPERVSTPLVAKPGRSFILREPLGVALIIAPWNYPFQTAILPLVGAIGAGNCVVLKPSELAPHTSALIAKWIPQYLDRDAIRVVEGGVPETTALLREKWDHIFYTGGSRVGRVIMEAASKHLTPVTLELGGKSPCIVDETADLDAAAKRITHGKFFNAGQTCVAPDYVLVHEAVHDALINRLTSTIRDFYGDDPKKSPDFARIINERHLDRLMSLLAGADVVAGGAVDRSERYIAPTVLRNVTESDAVMQDEIFGPILPVISVANVDSAIAFINRQVKPLALYLFSRRNDVHQRVLDQTSAGGTTINHVWMHVGVPELPFGGVGESGTGSYHGRHSFDTFSHRRAVLRKPAVAEPPLGLPPYSARKLRWIKRLL